MLGFDQMTSKTIFVAGHRGLAGGAILRELQAHGYERILTQARAELDLTRAEAVRDFSTLREAGKPRSETGAKSVLNPRARTSNPMMLPSRR